MKTISKTQTYWLSILLVVVALLPVAGCAKSALPPPVNISYRGSLFGLGEVIILTNTSSHHLYNVRVVGRNFDQVSSASVKATEHLSPGSSVEVGWMEFEAWIPLAGETIEVYCDDYLVPKVSIIPKRN